MFAGSIHHGCWGHCYHYRTAAVLLLLRTAAVRTLPSRVKQNLNMHDRRPRTSSKTRSTTTTTTTEKRVCMNKRSRNFFYHTPLYHLLFPQTLGRYEENKEDEIMRVSHSVVATTSMHRGLRTVDSVQRRWQVGSLLEPGARSAEQQPEARESLRIGIWKIHDTPVE